MAGSEQPVDQILLALRRLTQAMDRHSRKLIGDYGVSGPQAIVLRELAVAGKVIPSELARRMCLSQATVTGIVKRLEERGYLKRGPIQTDRRKVELRITPEGRRRIALAPPLLQREFVCQFEALPDHEQAVLLFSVQRLAAMMGSGEPGEVSRREGIDANPSRAFIPDLWNF